MSKLDKQLARLFTGYVSSRGWITTFTDDYMWIPIRISKCYCFLPERDTGRQRERERERILHIFENLRNDLNSACQRHMVLSFFQIFFSTQNQSTMHCTTTSVSLLNRRCAIWFPADINHVSVDWVTTLKNVVACSCLFHTCAKEKKLTVS